MPALRSGVKPFAFSSSTVIAVMICCSVNALPPTTMVCAGAAAASAPSASTPDATTLRIDSLHCLPPPV